MTPSMKMKKILSVGDFLDRALAIKAFQDVESLREDSIETENFYRELFARKRDNWEVPELDDNFHYLIEVFSQVKEQAMGKSESKESFLHIFSNSPSRKKSTQGEKGVLEVDVEAGTSASNGNIATEVFKCLPRFEEDDAPRVFPLKNRRAAGELGTVPSLAEFKQSWDSLTEDCLRYLDWTNLLAAGGAVAGCLAPLPDKILEVKGFGPQRIARRKYFHDEFLPGSDIDLFLYGVSDEQAKKKLLEIYDAVQAASPFPVRAFRSTHAITLVSQYPFRHVQIILRIYNSASEVLCGFDVDSCAVGFDGSKVVVPPRTAMAIMTQSNTVDMSRRSPSYEMRLSKYASRGFEIILPSLERDRIDPFIFEKRFDEAKGLSRLLLLEKLRTPEERLRYRIERQMQKNGRHNWRLMSRLRELERDRWNLNRHEGTEGVPLHSATEASDYSTIFLPWGPEWDAKRIERQTKKNDIKMNKYEIKENGEVTASKRKYKIHLCAVGTMEEVIRDPYPDDPPLPKDLPTETLESIVYGEVSWLVDNPGRQKIGSFHPISDEDWNDGAYFSIAAEILTKAAVANDVRTIERLLKEEEVKSDKTQKNLLGSKDFLGRSVLHLAALSGSIEACKVLLDHPLVDGKFLQARLSDGRTALHIAAMKGNVSITKLILEKRQNLAKGSVDSVEKVDSNVLFGIFDIDCADWEVKFSPLQYAIALGQVESVRILLHYNADVRKVAVHKDFDQSISSLSLLAIYSSECGKTGISNVKPIVNLLLAAGASFMQVDTEDMTCWHYLAMFPDHLKWNSLPIFLEAAKAHVTDSRMMALDRIDKYCRSPLYVATVLGNHKSVESLLVNGASPFFTDGLWSQMQKSLNPHCHGTNSASLSTEMLRSPIFAAAELPDINTLEAYCKVDKSYANLSITILAPPIYHGNQRARSDRSSKTMRVLDVLESVIQRAEDSWSSSYYEEREKDLEEAKSKIETKYKILIKNCPESVEVMWLSLMLEHNQAELEETKKSMMKKESADTEANRLTRIQDAISYIKKIGGERGPCEIHIGQPEMDGHHPSSTSSSKVPVPDPMNSFAEMSYRGFQPQWHSYYNSDSIIFSDDTISGIVKLFNVTNTGKIDELRHVVKNTNVFVKNTVGQTTPFFLAIKNKNVEAARTIFEGASKQHLYHIETEKAAERRKKEHEEEMQIRWKKVNTKNHSVQGLANRINNLNLATGDLSNMVSGPTTMRFKLEDAEAQLMLDKDDCGVVNELSSQIPPGELLLHRSQILTSGPLLDFKNRLKEMNVSRVSTGTISLTPLEVAVVGGDLTMVNEIIDLAQNMSFHTIGREDEVLNVDDEEISGNDEESSESVDSRSEGSQFQETNAVMTEAQLRYLMVGPGSVNQDLGGISLIEIAIVSDNVDIFSSIVSYAKEFALPLHLIDLWKAQIGQRERYAQQGRVFSPVHFIMKCGSQNLINALISKNMDDLIEWIFEKEYKSPSTSLVDRTYLAPFYKASKWVSDQITETKVTKEKVLERLWHVVSVDQRKRTALFYVPADLVSPVVAAGVKHIASGTPSLSFESARSDFVNARTPNGVSALMSAAALGDKDRVQILLKEGAARSLYTSDRKKWGVVHFVIEKVAPKQQREIVELLLKGASDSELNAMLLSPQAEHTPLMLAVSKGAEEKIVSLLIESTALCAVDTLARRDKGMNSALHLAVKGIIKNTKMGLETINMLLSRSPMQTEMENARGLTASDISLEHILSSFWRRGPRYHVRFGVMKEPKSTISEPNESEISFKRDLLDLLICAEANDRLTIGFNDVKLNTNHETESIQENSNNFPSEFSATSEEDCSIPAMQGRY